MIDKENCAENVIGIARTPTLRTIQFQLKIMLLKEKMS